MQGEARLWYPPVGPLQATLETVSAGAAFRQLGDLPPLLAEEPCCPGESRGRVQEGVFPLPGWIEGHCLCNPSFIDHRTRGGGARGGGECVPSPSSGVQVGHSLSSTSSLLY